MTVTKESYAKNKENNIGSKRPKNRPTPPKELEIIFDNLGNPIAKNREYRRKKNRVGLYTRKGFIIAIRKIRITRKNKSGNVKTKYINVD